MPAVDLTRLAHQIHHVTEAFSDPARLRSRCLDLLEFYGSRVRPSYRSGRSASVRSFGVPPGVMRAVQQALEDRAAADPYAGSMAAEILWATPVLEARWLAVALLEHQPLDGLANWIADWSETAQDSMLLERLAAGPVRRLWRTGPDLFWSSVGRSLAEEGPATVVTLLALEDIVPDLEPDDLPRVFAALESSPIPLAGDAWRAYIEVVRACARRSPPETAHLLVEALEHARPGATRLTRQTMGEFPLPQREALRQALRLGEAKSAPARSRPATP